MGDPRRLKKKYKRPNTPWEKARLEMELKYLGEYGLRNKREFWRHRYQLRKFRRMARELRVMPEDLREKGFKELVGRLSRLGLVGENATTDDILSLTVEDILNRRLQTLVYKKGLARTIYQARQLIVHKHITIGDKVVASPSYLVLKEEEDLIGFRDTSPFNGHPEKIFGEPKKAEESSSGEGGGEGGAPEKRSRRPPRKRSRRAKAVKEV